MHKRLLTILIFSCLSGGINQLSIANINSPVPADTSYKLMKDTAAFNKQLNEASQKLISLECDFVQEKNLSLLAKPVMAKGHLCFMNGGFVRWEYTEPFVYLVIISNNRIFVKDQDRKENYDLTANQAFLQMSSQMGNIMQGKIAGQNRDFSIEYFENSSNFRLHLTPLQKEYKDYFRTIIVDFGKTDCVVNRIRMVEISGDYTDILFSNKKLNQTISADRFEFK